ncbi:hypothetical protein HII36_34945 [Nonomuraea sp. NN258]|uniref:hypothetical protein n=1 Tax=Nonomuraea antri TaxID=2730852 RepID=UPI0015681076|nr:hypothetical protein [Nonomuraea antri]NRQ36999.1 hypothetical protein [Nonomuraea antri]
MTEPEEPPPLASLIAALCARLEKADGLLVTDGPVREAASAIVAAARSGSAPAELMTLFAALEEALRAEGLPHGIGADAYRSGQEPTTRYAALSGLRPRGVHAVLRCPADEPLRCARVERATWSTRASPPGCPVHDLSLAEERLKL